MKICSNPGCKSNILHRDDESVCPFCFSPLVDCHDSTESGRQTGFQSAEEMFYTGSSGTSNPARFMETERFHRLTYHGIITEIGHNELFYNHKMKMFRSLLLGEPFQVGHQVVSYALRLESLSSDGQIADFVLWGDYLGWLNVGDEVILKTKGYWGRKIASVYNITTASKVRPKFQYPAWIVRAYVLLPIALLTIVLTGIVWTCFSGKLAALTAIFCILVTIISILIQGFQAAREE